MIDFSDYTYAENLRRMLEQVDDSLDKRQGSLIQTAVAPGAWFCEGMALDMAKVQAAAYVETATGQDLDNYVAAQGLTRIAATAAVRQGVFNAQVPAGSVFKTINGEDSVLFTSGAYIGSEGGSLLYEMTCQTAGTIGNSYSGQIIPVTPVAGLTSAAIGQIITEGTDAETDESLRARFDEAVGHTACGGNIAQYRQAILAIPGVGGVQVYPANTYEGGGTVLCSIISDTYGAPSSALVQTVQNIICPPEEGESLPSENGYGVAPIGARCTISGATALTVNIAGTITIRSASQSGNPYEDEIRESIDEYITSVAKAWGNPVVGRVVSYPVVVYLSRVIYAILSVPEVVSVASLTINGSAADLTLTETSAVQQVPVLGEVNFNVQYA